MRAVRVRTPGQPPVVESVATPRPGPDEVLVRVRACGICGSDLHVLDGDVAVPRLPLTLGHEAAGEVAEVGAGVERFVEGDRVLINPIIGCDACDACADGSWHRCDDHVVLGVGVDGAQADYVVVPGRNLVPVPPSLDFAQAAVLADAVAGPFRALRRSGLRAGGSVAIFGLGGLGLHAVIIARQLYGARVVGVDIDPVARERALAFGASAVFDGLDPRVATRIRAEHGPVDASLEFVGAVPVVEQALRSLRRGGTAVVMGVGPGRLELAQRLEPFVVQEWSLVGSYGYGRDDLVALVDHVQRGDLTIEGTVSATLPLADAAEGYDLLASRRGSPTRVVLLSDPDLHTPEPVDPDEES
ncbi:zinc-binding dehydrogenase [Aeromicrobium alkaliterrae]|uniref:Zinc-binding dehydrogenase n=2 Tax=Aeromicrobium alkaliterrae TaxID=302168 RepID=A0ABN2K0K7_9ACTN